MSWTCRSVVERGANDMMSRNDMDRWNVHGGCGSCGMTRGCDRNARNDRNDRNGRNDCRDRNDRNCGDCTIFGTARENERAGSCGICNIIRGDARNNNARCSGGQTTKWMRRLQVLDFSLQELVLYLDMYPDCHRALEKFRSLREERAKVAQMLEASGTPITALGNDCHENWNWIDSPWPWEFDFPGNGRD